MPFGVPNRAARLERSRVVLIEDELSDLVLYLQQLIETVEVLGDHEAVPPLLSAGEDAFAQLEWPTETPDYIARVASTREQQAIWELPKDLSPIARRPRRLPRGNPLRRRATPWLPRSNGCAGAIRRTARWH